MDKQPACPAPYSAYLKRTVPPEDAELTHVGPQTPCGEWLRRAWQPVAMSSELRDLPLAKRILGEDLVLFRDGSGRIGLLQRNCSHRGASLEYGIIMERGISCCYHGWCYDVDGRILDTPGEPAGSPLKHEIVHGAYPTVEHKGLIFAYFGPPESKPPFPLLDTLNMPDTQPVPFSLSIPCNWLQVYENTQDPIHVVYLHSRMSGVQFGAASGVMQVIDYRQTPLGMINIQTRRCGDLVWNRTTETILPNGNQGGAIWEEATEAKYFRRAAFTRWMVPVDDTHTVTIGWRLFGDLLDPDRLGDQTKVGLETIDFVGQTEDRPYEERQRHPGDYEVQVSQRPIARHALEHLATTDRGVIMLRKLVRRGIQDLARGVAPAPVGRVEGAPLGTYVQDTVCPIAPDAGDDRALLARFGRAVADVVVKSGDQPPAEREALLRRLCDTEFAASPVGTP